MCSLAVNSQISERVARATMPRSFKDAYERGQSGRILRIPAGAIDRRSQPACPIRLSKKAVPPRQPGGRVNVSPNANQEKM